MILLKSSKTNNGDHHVAYCISNPLLALGTDISHPLLALGTDISARRLDNMFMPITYIVFLCICFSVLLVRTLCQNLTAVEIQQTPVW